MRSQHESRYLAQNSTITLFSQANGGAVLGGLIFNGTLVSRNCGIHIAISAAGVQLEKYYSKAVNYALMMTAVAFLQVLHLITPTIRPQ